MVTVIVAPPKPWKCSICGGKLKEWTIGVPREEQSHPECKGNQIALECLSVFRQALKNERNKGEQNE